MSALIPSAVLGGEPPPRRTLGPRARRIGLGVFFTSIAVNAVLGLYALLAPDFGETDGKILQTSYYVTVAVLLVLACEPAWERRLLGPVPVAAAICSVVGLAVVIAGVWSRFESDVPWKLAGTATTIGVAGAVAGMLALARLSHRFLPVVIGALCLLAVAAVMIVVAMWAEPSSGWYPRSLGAVLILFAALAVSTPVLHRLSRTEEPSGTGRQATVLFCPFCGEQLGANALGSADCSHCGQTFTVWTGRRPSTMAQRERTGRAEASKAGR